MIILNVAVISNEFMILTETLYATHNFEVMHFQPAKSNVIDNLRL